MIEQLMVKDYILFDYALVDFTHGMHVITGETGAGKSLLIDAIGYLSGKRINGNIVRKGKDKAILQMVCSTSSPKISQMLEEKILTEKEEDIYKRGRNANSHTKAKNADIVTYRMSTGFEAVLGYLHMTDQIKRLEELIDWCIVRVEGAQHDKN